MNKIMQIVLGRAVVLSTQQQHSQQSAKIMPVNSCVALGYIPDARWSLNRTTDNNCKVENVRESKTVEYRIDTLIASGK